MMKKLKQRIQRKSLNYKFLKLKKKLNFLKNL